MGEELLEEGLSSGPASSRGGSLDGEGKRAQISISWEVEKRQGRGKDDQVKGLGTCILWLDNGTSEKVREKVWERVL